MTEKTRLHVRFMMIETRGGGFIFKWYKKTAFHTVRTEPGRRDDWLFPLSLILHRCCFDRVIVQGFEPEDFQSFYRHTRMKGWEKIFSELGDAGAASTVVHVARSGAP